MLLGALCLWFGAAAISGQIRHATSQRELALVTDRIATAERDNARLARELERMQEPSWLALVARERLNVKQPDETVVFVYPSEKSAIVSTPAGTPDPGPLWRRWWQWLWHQK